MQRDPLANRSCPTMHGLPAQRAPNPGLWGPNARDDACGRCTHIFVTGSGFVGCASTLSVRSSGHSRSVLRVICTASKPVVVILSPLPVLSLELGM